MDNRKFRLHDGKRGVALGVRVTPRATRNEITEIQSDGTVKVRLVASPTDEEANTILISFMAEVLGVSTKQIEIVAGQMGRDKLISVLDVDEEDVHHRLAAYLE